MWFQYHNHSFNVQLTYLLGVRHICKLKQTTSRNFIKYGE